MKSFSEILKEVGRTDKDTAHSYGQWYDLWFAPIRLMQNNILEIGSCMFGGGGLLALEEYFPNSRIFGVDNNCEPCKENLKGHDRIKLFNRDAYNGELERTIMSMGFDIIIDDCLHEFSNQSDLLRVFRYNLTDRGFYVIEDCRLEKWLPHFKDLRTAGLQQTVIDQSVGYDNCLIRFDKTR